MTLPKPAVLILDVALAGMAAAVALLAARSTWNSPAVVLALSVAALPALVLLVAERPAAALGVFVAGQVLEAFEYRTPVGTVSFSVIILSLLLLFHWRSAVNALRTERDVVVASVLFGGWVASYALRLRYAPASAVAREVVTVVSFGAVVATGLAVARRTHVVRSVGIGATSALLFLGACGVLASLGAIPAPDRITTAPRALLGFGSPIERNYGLNVAFDSVASLVPLCVPWLLVSFAAERGRRRLGVAATLVSFLLVIVFVFQAREIVVQLVVAMLATACVLRPRMGWIVSAIALPLLITGLVAMERMDRLSSDTRSAPLRHIVTVSKEDPQRLLLGTDEDRFYRESLSNSVALVQATRNFTDFAIHNFFLSNLVAGGILAFVLTGLLFAVVMRRGWRLWRSNQDDNDARVLFVACFVVLVTLLLESERANDIGYWLLAGLLLGRPLREVSAAEPSSELAVPKMHLRLVQVRTAIAMPLGMVRRSVQRNFGALLVPLLLVPGMAVGIALAHAPKRTAIGYVTFTERPAERAYFGNPPLVLRTLEVRSGRLALRVRSTNRTTLVTVESSATRAQDAARRVNGYLNAYVPWYEGAAIGRLRAGIRLLRAQLARLRDHPDAAKKEAFNSQYRQLKRLSHQSIGRFSALQRAEVVKVTPIGITCAIAIALGLFLGLGAALAAEMLSVRNTEIADVTARAASRSEATAVASHHTSDMDRGTPRPPQSRQAG